MAGRSRRCGRLARDGRRTPCPVLGPPLDYLSWRETCTALHLYLQIAGKYRLAHTPWLNHSWNATFYVTPRGLTSSPIPDGAGIEILFDLHDHRVVGQNGEGATASFALGPMTVAAFHAAFLQLIAELGGTPVFNGQPNEVPFPVPFAEDDRDRPYDGMAVRRFHQGLIAVDRVFKQFRTGFLGKSSPVHLFWGSFDLAVTRFSALRPRAMAAVFRPCRTVWRRRPMTARFPRRVLAGRWRRRLSGLLRLCLSGARRLSRRFYQARGRVLERDARRVHPAL